MSVGYDDIVVRIPAVAPSDTRRAPQTQAARVRLEPKRPSSAGEEASLEVQP